MVSEPQFPRKDPHTINTLPIVLAHDLVTNAVVVTSCGLHLQLFIHYLSTHVAQPTLQSLC